MHHLSVLGIVGLLGLYAFQITVLALSIEMAIWEAPLNKDFKTCSAIITDVEGCSGWSKCFCKTDSDCYISFSCNSCWGVKEATVKNCDGVRLALDFDAVTPWICFRNDDDVQVRRNCTLKSKTTKGHGPYISHEAGAMCDPYEQCDDPKCVAPEKPVV